MWMIGVSSLIGLLLGALTAYLLVTFEQKWYKFATTVIGVGGPTSSLVWLHKYYGAINEIERLKSTFFLLLVFIITFFVVLLILIHFIKVENNEDIGVIRTRDIILGRKDYIETFYKARKKQIDEKLNIPELEKREKEVKSREDAADVYDNYLREQFDKLKKKTRHRLTMTLPDKKIVVLNEEFIGQIPSFLDGFLLCIGSINKHIETLNEKAIELDYETFLSTLTDICVSIMSFLFGNSTQVRTHFRIYNRKSRQYELLVGIEGEKFINSLTPIPYMDSMIGRSDFCHQALIKSLNAGTTKYNGNNNTIWKDYMTYAFYNLRYNENPVISFGISVKNEKRYKYLFYFLNYVKFENYLNGFLMDLSQLFSVEKLLQSYEDLSDG